MTRHYPFRETGDEMLLAVRVTPNASRDEIGSIEDDASGRRYLKIRVRAVPEDGAANKAVCKLIAKAMGLPKSSVEVRSGQTSRLKQIALRVSREDLETWLDARD